MYRTIGAKNKISSRTNAQTILVCPWLDFCGRRRSRRGSRIDREKSSIGADAHFPPQLAEKIIADALPVRFEVNCTK